MAIDLFKLTPEQLNRFLHIQSIVAGQEEAQARIRVLRDYYDGEHPILLSDRQKEFIGKELTDGDFLFAHNTVKSVIDTLRERLSVNGFTVNGATVGGADGGEGAQTPESQIAQRMWGWWEENRYDAQQIRLHRRALRDGISFVMVDYDNVEQRPRFTLHQAYDGKTGITYHRDPENPERCLFLNKYWYTFDPLKPGKTGIQRKTTYLEHEIRKYIMATDGQSWQEIRDPGDASWPLPWVDRDGAPLGINTIPFENPGGSEVAQIIGLQNALNKSWLDLIAAADASGFPILVHEQPADGGFPGDTNAVDDDDIEGADEFVVAPGRMLDVDGKVYRIEGANLSQLIDTIHVIVETIAGISRTPQYYLRPVGGDVPSGEALKQLESGLVSRAVERQLIFGQSWADVMAMAYKVAQTFGPTIPEVKRLRVETTWDAAETRQDLLEAQTAEVLKRLGVPDEEIWQMLGFDAEKIAQWKRTAQSDQAATIANVAQALQARQTTPTGAGVGAGANGNGVQ